MRKQDLVNVLIIGWIIWFFSLFMSFIVFDQKIFFPALITAGYMTGAFLLNPSKKVYSRCWGFMSFIWDSYYTLINAKFPSLHKMYVLNVLCQILYLGVISIITHALIYTFLFSLSSIFNKISPLEIKDVLGISWFLFARNPILLFTWVTGAVFGNTVVTLINTNLDVTHENK